MTGKQVKKRKERLAEAILSANRSLSSNGLRPLPRSNHAPALFSHCFLLLTDGAADLKPVTQKALRDLVRILKKDRSALKAAWKFVIVYEIMES
jgi:hypothetical protein